jgi:hypothetical protein
MNRLPARIALQGEPTRLCHQGHEFSGCEISPEKGVLFSEFWKTNALMAIACVGQSMRMIITRCRRMAKRKAARPCREARCEVSRRGRILSGVPPRRLFCLRRQQRESNPRTAQVPKQSGDAMKRGIQDAVRFFYVYVGVVCVASFANFSAHGAEPAGSPPPTKEPIRPNPAKPTDEADDIRAMMRFAPMWIPVPRFPKDPNAAVPSFVYAMIWQPAWQQELGLSAEQKKMLMAINAEAVAAARRNAEAFQSLSPEEQQAQIKASRQKPARSPRQSDIAIAKQIEAVLTARQLQTLKDFSFPGDAIGLLYLSSVRAEIDFSPEQEDRFRLTINEKIARFQTEYLKRADKSWDLLSQKQQAELPEVVRRQGPTSAVLAIAGELGFNYDNFIPCYPMLSESPVRERLGLNAEQDKKLHALMAESGARLKKALDGTFQPDSEADDKKQVEAILSPEQLTKLNEINFRRQVVLALGYPEKQEMIGMTDQQKAALAQLETYTSEQLHHIDREMLGKALEIITPTQRKQLSAEIDRRVRG